MSQAVGMVYGAVFKIIVLMLVAFLCFLGARLGGNHLVRINPQWSKMRKQAAQSGSVFAAVVLFAIFVIVFAR